MCTCDGLYQQLEWGYGLEGSCVQLSWGDWDEGATGQTEHVSPGAGRIHPVDMGCISIHVHIFSLLDLHPAELESRGDEAVGAAPLICVTCHVQM